MKKRRGQAVFIYALLDPLTLLPRYVGKAANPEKRLTIHLRDKAKTYKANWIRSLRSKGLIPLLKILKRISNGVGWQDDECEYIRVFKAMGYPLTNGTEGGEGVRATPAVRRKISRTLSGRPQPWSRGDRNAMRRPEVSEKCAAANRGKKRSLEIRQEQSKSRKGIPKRPRTPEHCQHLSEALKGLPHYGARDNEQCKAAHAESLKKLHIAKIGVPRPDMLGDRNPAKRPEVRQKIRDWWAQERVRKAALVE